MPRILKSSVLARAQGCLLGQIAGDALGSLVEFRSAESIRREYPGGVRELVDGGCWDTIAGQPTDDSELAISLARMLAGKGAWEAEVARAAYVEWLESEPFDCGRTVLAGLTGRTDQESQANGALMRVSPLGVFGARDGLWGTDQVAVWASEDAGITHPHPVCRQANSLFAMAIAKAVRTGCKAEDLYEAVKGWATSGGGRSIDASLVAAIEAAPGKMIEVDGDKAGWVLFAFRNALHELVKFGKRGGTSIEESIVDTVGRGGDTDTNAAVCGALLGAVGGRAAVPERWVRAVVSCRPASGDPRVRRPRPERYWPVDVLELAGELVGD